GALARFALLRRLPRPQTTLDDLRAHIDRLGTRFDGRLRVVAVDRGNGRRVVFGGPRAPRASVAEAVTASCTVPWLFAPVTIDGREYVDGGVWSPTNLDAAPAGRDTHVLCLNPTASIPATSGALAVMRALLLRRLPTPTQNLDDLHRHLARFGVRFDGRLRVTAVDRRTGRRVVFGSPGAPSATVADAVTASCTVPWLFEPVEISGREYVDGGVWSPTNLDVAPAGRDAQVLCLSPTASLPGSNSALALIRRVTRSAISLEALVLRRRGVAVRLVAPNVESSAAMGTNFMAREPRGRVIAAGYRQGLQLARADGAPRVPPA
ncbi:MAG: patatin-like phospholipase family protein, partial [Solirubrobacterales bacterium]|nr:patatin-like phospholipase family protein [Solirubrobacterales bacterium]